MIDVSRVTSKGQITIPVEMRKKLGIKEGDKVVFIEKDGYLVLSNSNRVAFEEFQAAMAGEAEKAGIKTEQDVINLVKEVRREIWEEKHAGHSLKI